MLRRILFVSVAMLFLAAAHPAYPQENQDAKEFKVLDGTVASVDWVGSTLVLRCLVNGNFDEKTFYVNSQTKISKGGRGWGLSNINVGDHVKIQYYERKLNWPLAVDIEVAL